MTTTRHPRKHESEARAAQLKRLSETRKAERAAKREAKRQQVIARRARKAYTQSNVHGAAFTTVLPGEPAPPTGRQVIAEIQRIAMGGVMPTPDRYDYARCVSYPTAERVCELMGMSWDEVAEEAGLKLRKEQILCR